MANENGRVRDTVHAMEGWRARYSAARMQLSSAERMAALQRRVSACVSRGPARADILEGEARARQAQRVGLFAGSFNPLTDAHIALAAMASKQARLDVLLWSFAAVTVDKEQVERASLPDRLAQVAAHVERHADQALALFSRGLYVDQAAALHQELPGAVDVSLVVGFDKVVQIFDPHYYADRDAALSTLFELARLLVFPRNGYGAADLAALLERAENRPYASAVTFLDLPPEFAHDSSTEVRASLASELPSRALSSPQIRRLITPEGVALAETGAYDTTHDPDHDPYVWRQRWIHSLQTVPAGVVNHMPALSRIIQATLRDDEMGSRLRRWVMQPDQADGHGTRELERLLSMLTGSHG